MKSISSILALLLLLFCAWPQLAKCAAAQPMIEPHTQAMPLMPFLDYLIDESMSMDIEEAANAPGWQPLNRAKLPAGEGAMWLRFTIAPVAHDAKPQTFLLDMGQSVPGRPILYESTINELAGSREWRENLPTQRNILLLPEASTEAQPCYIRIEGLPGPWFAPMIRTPHNAATNWSSLARPAAILALGVVMVLCLLRGMGESGQWRYWTALFVAAALAQAILGMPLPDDIHAVRNLAAILLPGISLMFLPHVGRHLMATRANSRSIDIQLFLLSLPGAVLALLPLIPGWNWLDRWVDLWPIGATLFIPTALGAWMMGLPGCRRFLLACFILPLFTGLALVALEFGIPANILASGPNWGVALGALLLTASAMPMPAAAKQETEPAKKEALPPMQLEPDPVINLEHPLDDPNLRLIPATNNTAYMEKEPIREIKLQRIPPDDLENDNIPIAEMEARENALRAPIDQIMREASLLTQTALPPSARQSVEKLLSACQLLANIISRPGRASDEENFEKHGEEIFNLEKIMRNAHDSVMAAAEYSGIALSWYMPPHLGPRFKGDARTLEEILRLLLESAARATSRGVIKLSARHVPESTDHGHILFTVEDDGQGYPPRDRSSLALIKAWELAGASGGYLNVESSTQGATISFSLHLTPVEEMGELDAAPAAHVILAAGDAEERRNLSRIIETANCTISEVSNINEMLAVQAMQPAALLVMQGAFARPASSDMVREFAREARQDGIAKPAVLAITEDQSQWRLLKASGFTHAMLEPVDPEVLRKTVMRLASSHRPEEPTKTAGPLFNANATNLAPAAKMDAAPDAEPAPTMLIEQNFSLASAFEGPDWLGEKEDFTQQEETPQSEEPVQEPEQPATPDMPDASPTIMAPQEIESATQVEQPRPAQIQPATPLQNAQPAQQKPEIIVPAEPDPINLGQSEHHGNESDPNRPQVDSVAQSDIYAQENINMEPLEWVGEPMPIGTPVSKNIKSEPAQPNSSPTPQAKPEPPSSITSNPIDAPMQAAAEKSGQTSEEPLLDYIAGATVKAAERRQTTDRNVDEEDSGMKKFVNNSVNLVANALSSMLKHTANMPEAAPEPPAAPTPAETPLQAQSDPVILAMLARIEEAMSQANTAIAKKNAPAIAAATSIICREAEEFGLRRLAKFASCVERAARQNDLLAVHDLMPDLTLAVERTRLTILQKNPG